jgi:5-methylcytosine-specific restriction endonuclease McrA
MMSQSILSSPTLVLNANWRPIGVDTVQASIKKIMNDSCRFVNPDTYELYDRAVWCELDPIVGQKFVASAKRHFVAPEIVLLTDYDDMPKNEVRLTKRNVLVRDRFQCLYCGVKVAKSTPGSKVRKLAEYTWDHILPRSQGGKTTWENIATACFKCNSKKADRTPSQAGMKLRGVPKKPKWSLSLVKHLPKRPASWDRFLSKDMIDAEPVGID